MTYLEKEIEENPMLLRDYRDLVEEQFRHSLFKTPTPRDIVRLLDLEEVEHRIEKRRAKLLFDGKSLQWIEDRSALMRWSAFSGKPGFSGKEHQTMKDVGPIPEGLYVALQSDFQRWEDTPFFNRAACILNLINIKVGRWPGCTIAWGTRRIGLRPSSGTNVHGRNNFTIHGGWYPGSIGCIDLTDSMESFAKEFLYYAKDMELEVRY
ncbi:hypothetical protein [Ralstonia sp. UBA689]|uniref:hypothetical protein n=1 Tax=Ralstonia sp. UBA689 TaxID=1947373 RepID=UPI0025E7A102|nr:hypothetical protein [Ralstonia sp. UBA689]